MPFYGLGLAQKLPDDVALKFGEDSDGVIILDSAGLAADVVVHERTIVRSSRLS